MRLIMVDESGAVVQEYNGVTAQVDGVDIEIAAGMVETLKVVIPGESPL